MEECLSSVQSQTLKEIEIICIDAGSTDGTLEIIQNHAKNDARIRMIQSKKKSYGYQVNCGIREARGEYVAIVETDDFVDHDMYENLYQCAKENDVDIVKSNYRTYWTQNDGARVYCDRSNFTQNELYAKVLHPKDNPLIALEDWYLWTGIYKRKFLLDEDIRLSESSGAAFQDIGYIHQTNAKAKTAYYLYNHFYNYCIDREDSSSNLGKSLIFGHNEYHQLLEMEWDEESLILLYLRMAKSFVVSCHTISNENVIDEEYRKCFDWFSEQIKCAEEKGYIGAHNIVPGIWKRLNDLSVGLDVAYQIMMDRKKRIENTIGKPGDYDIIIFGCGERGQNALKIFKKKKYNIIAFMDNNRNIWNTTIESIPVCMPDNLTQGNDKVRYLIANELYYVEIEKQLIDLGIETKKICIYF